jgi:hypothetical protein
MRLECEEEQEDSNTKAAVKRNRAHTPDGEASSRTQTPLQPSQPHVGCQRQDRGWNCPSKNNFVVNHCQTSKDELAKTSGPNRGRDRRQPNGNHYCHPHA